MTNNHGSEQYSSTNTTSTNDDEQWKKIEPNTVQNDKELQDALNGEENQSSQVNDRTFDFDGKTWGGMQSGYLEHDSTQESEWLSTVPIRYRDLASKWESQMGMIKITPIQQRQKFTYSTISYIAQKQAEPKTQVIPITDLSVLPHQIKFDLYDTTEGRVGVSNAVEKHMTVEFDVLLSELIMAYWVFGDDNHYNLGGTIMPNIRRRFWESIDNGTYLEFEGDLESTKEFADFRATFLQQHSGWVCKFISLTFGVFQGVINDVNYTIGGGETYAKWHVKLEEAIFMSNNNFYSPTGQKPEVSTDGSQNMSGDATIQENIE